MAAVETLCRGYQRFVVVGTSGADNTGVIRTAPTRAMTNSTYQGYGNTVYGNFQTTYHGGNTIAYGSHDAAIGVVMMNPGEPGFTNGVDGRETLGADWQKLVTSGIKTCS